ncbi:sigma-70 family RNA polymerase sigma factor [Aliirhizobium smilacinae]|jgi:RNA polymerase sigma-70 factor (ECF subfamily)|uniref:Sigma-70 family RNA polymerase sigma factor n=1 Tax=Aliirhizobium smilacinae TaxID=1395944 RepID=A0A5C4XKD6_9HYPH|nr:sigma-70 family RNA polymerase sigma factor [Rhizobium smilacinae]TNM63768.1 sigma-70 family RNA polymerase sigma factor [Rhizobium smilacinae]
MKQLTETELKALMLLSLDGDEVAYRCLLDMLRHLLVSYYGRRLSRSAPADVDDLVQDTLLALHQRRITYDRGRPFTAWFFTIARHKLVDHYRRSDDKAHLGMEMLEEIAGGYSEDAVSARMDVNRLLESLPAWQGEMIRRVRLEGHSVSDTAAKSGRSEAVVKISVFRGIQAIAAKLKGESSDR